MESTFLLIDDDRDDREIFCEALNIIDPYIRLEVAASCDEAVKSLNNGSIRSPEIIFMDLYMPGKDGWECISIIQKIQEFQGIPVVIYSQNSDLLTSNGVAEPDTYYILNKSMNFSGLLQDLKTVIQKVRDSSRKAQTG